MNAKDEFGKTALATACGTGSPRCIKMLVEAGSDINDRDMDGVVPLHEAIYRGNTDCLYELIKYKPDSSIRQRSGKQPIDCVFIDNMHGTLKYILYDPDFLALSNNDPNLSVTNENIERLMSQSIMYKAPECQEILLKYQEEHKLSIEIDYSNLFARTLTVYNFTHWKEMKGTRINTEMLI